ncbi:MAG: flavodoxin family protein [Dehalococcoidia bacterium]|nr:flavodoxin family protein [Dehalococcoidia bacterium]
MKVLGVVSSPRKGGNTEVLVSEVLASAQEAGAETEILLLRDKTIQPCDGCRSCHKTGLCHVQDGMQEIYPKMEAADALVLGTPVYFWTVTAQCKALIDRTYCYHINRHLRGKIGAGVIATRRAGATQAFSVINNFFMLQRLIPAGGVFGYGEDRGDVRNDAQALGESKALGRVVVRYVKMAAGGLLVPPPPPK